MQARKSEVAIGIIISFMDRHLPPAEDIVRSLAHAAPSLSVPRPPGPGENHGDEEEEDGGEHDGNDEEEDDDEVPEQLVVDDDGVDQVESEEPEEESRDPAGQLIVVVIVMLRNNISLMVKLTCNSSREVAV